MNQFRSISATWVSAPVKLSYRSLIHPPIGRVDIAGVGAPRKRTDRKCATGKVCISPCASRVRTRTLVGMASVTAQPPPPSAAAGTVRLGVTAPISLAGPDQSDLRLGRQLEECLHANNLYESKAGKQLRETVRRLHAFFCLPEFCECVHFCSDRATTCQECMHSRFASPGCMFASTDCGLMHPSRRR